MHNREAGEGYGPTPAKQIVPQENKMSSLILRSFNSKSIRQRADGWVSLTDMATAGGKLFGNWNQLQSTKDFLEYAEGIIGFPIIKSSVGNHNGSELGGAWGHPKVAIKFAAWVSIPFEFQMISWTEEILTTGSASIATKVEPQTLQPGLVQHWEMAKAMGLHEDPEVKAAFVSRLLAMADLGSPAATIAASVSVDGIDASKTFVTIMERCDQLGFTSHRLGSRQDISNAVSRSDTKPTGKRRKYGNANSAEYVVTPKLDAIIKATAAARGFY